MRIEYIRPAFRICCDDRWSNKLSFASLSLHSSQFEHEQEWLNKCSNERPYDMRYGDDTEISKEEINYIVSLHEKYEKLFKWKVGDMLILDNIWWSHARYPYNGERNIVAMMGYPLIATKQHFENDQFISYIDFAQDIRNHIAQF